MSHEARIHIDATADTVIGTAIGPLSWRLTRRCLPMGADGLTNEAESVERLRAELREVR